MSRTIRPTPTKVEYVEGGEVIAIIAYHHPHRSGLIGPIAETECLASAVTLTLLNMYSKYFTTYVSYKPPPAVSRVLPLPPVSETELHGQLLDWASQYLYSKQFPWNLITILLKELKNNFDKIEFTNSKTKEIEGVFWYNALDTKQLIIDKIDEICLNHAKEYNSEILEIPFNLPFHEISCLSVKNARRTLEDRFTVVPSLDHIFNLPVRTSYFAVFDGHDGAEAANYAAAQLHVNLIVRESFPENIEQAIMESFQTTDDDFLLKCVTTDHKSGTTLALTIFIDNKVYVAWVGDSQVMVCRGSTGVDSVVVPHKPGRLDEIERISDLGGEVSRYDSTDVWRVNGCLAVSRAIGDPEFKKFVISTPDIKEVNLDGTEEYIILATDGLWDDVSPERCHELVKSKLISELTHEGLAHSLVEEAKSKGSKDNTTLIIIFMKPVKDLITKYINESPSLSGPEKLALLNDLEESRSSISVSAKRSNDEPDPTHQTGPTKIELDKKPEPSSSGCLI